VDVTLRLFAGHAEAVGTSLVRVTVAPPATVGSLRQALPPALAALGATSMVAVNSCYAADDHPLAADDEVALIPPVAGG